MKKNTHRKRLARAFLIVVGLIAFVPVSGMVAKGVTSATGLSDATEGLHAERLLGASDPLEVLDGLEALAGAESFDVPQYFAEEIGFADAVTGVWSSSGGDVVGYTLDCGSEAALEGLRAHMAQMGWTEVSLGDVPGATFMKNSGTCRWTLATCTQSGEATCVVFRSVVQ